MARVVDRARNLVVVAHEGTWDKLGVTADVLCTWLDDHAHRARHVEQAIALLYGAVVSYIATCLSIALDRAVSGSLTWLPVSLAILGTLLLFAGGARMVAESRLSGRQIQDEIRRALEQMEANESHDLRTSRSEPRRDSVRRPSSRNYAAGHHKRTRAPAPGS
jgi:hypothetical protein